MLMPTCKQLTMRRMRGIEKSGPLSRLMTKLHMAMCPNCRHNEKNLALISNGIELALLKKSLSTQHEKDLRISEIEQLIIKKETRQ